MQFTTDAHPLRNLLGWESYLVERFNSKIDKQGPNGCWLWMASLNGYGYGQFYVPTGGRYKHLSAHRVVYELSVGPIPKGRHVHHTCHNRPCVNPGHLTIIEPNIHGQMHSAEANTADRKPRTHCQNGHEFTEQNTRYDQGGGRHCRTCEEARKKNRPTGFVTKPKSTRLYCVHGHMVAGSNVYVREDSKYTEGRRECRRCSIDSVRRGQLADHEDWKAKRRARRKEIKIEQQASGEEVAFGPFMRLYCKNGHFVAGDNLRVYSHGSRPKQRECKACEADHQRANRARKKALHPPRQPQSHEMTKAKMRVRWHLKRGDQPSVFSGIEREAFDSLRDRSSKQT